jgi:hypothetical protein
MGKAFDRKGGANSRHAFLTGEMQKKTHSNMEQRKTYLNDTKYRPSGGTAEEYDLKQTIYTPKPTIFPVRPQDMRPKAHAWGAALPVGLEVTPTGIAPLKPKAKADKRRKANQKKKHQERQRVNLDRWGNYKPKHQEWSQQKDSSFQSAWGESKKQHFAYETQANLIGFKKNSTLKEKTGERLGNKFTNWVGVDKYKATGLITAVEPERIHGRSKYPY